MWTYREAKLRGSVEVNFVSDYAFSPERENGKDEREDFCENFAWLISSSEIEVDDRIRRSPYLKKRLELLLRMLRVL